MPKFEIAKLKLDLPKVEVPKPLYAGAGVADLAVATVKEYVDTMSKKVVSYRSDVTAKVTGYQKQVASFEPKAFADTARSKATARVETLTAEAKAGRAAVEALPAKVTSFYKETSSEALDTYEDLAKRGEVFVAKLRREAPDQVTVSVKGTKPAPARKAPAKKTTAKKAPAKKAPAKKAPAAKKTTAKKAPGQDA